MYTKALLSACLLATASASAVLPVRDTGRICGTTEPSAEHIQISKNLAAQEKANPFQIAATINVDVYFHVVGASTSVADGYATDKMLSDQLAVMNTDYAPHGIAFVLRGTDRTVNSAWSNDQTGGEMAMKQALRKGTYASLNLYFIKKPRQQAFGYCYFPVSASPGSSLYIQDGCTIMTASMPGGSYTDFNLGKTVTHEVGHWFGLYHTFQGGCSAAGDSVSDTPAQASATSGCPSSRDSCPSQPGLDPIHNYMDYSIDRCYTEFTAGQQTRMYSFWNSYRAGK